MTRTSTRVRRSTCRPSPRASTLPPALPSAAPSPITPDFVDAVRELAGRRYDLDAELCRLTALARRMPAWEIAYLADRLAAMLDGRGKGSDADAAAAAGTPPAFNAARPRRVDHRPGRSNRSTGLQSRNSRIKDRNGQGRTNGANRR
ncbi:MAG: hypothetical protein IT450_20630 [Phycisphaerales bacterium]|nr:hypothetical protein [Phycisphaerales bacterium]